MAPAQQLDWHAARRAVAAAGPRLTSLLRSARRPDALALGEWDLRQLVLHISHSVDTATAMVNGGGNLLDDIWQLSSLSGVMIRGEGHRDLADVADRIDAGVAAFIAAQAAAEDAGHDGSAVRPWLVTGTDLSLSALTCEVLSELTVHGLDVARTEGVPWPIDRTDAALIVSGFLFPSLHALGRAVVDQAAARQVRARFEVRLRGGGRAWLCFHDGDFSIEASPGGPVDCYLSVDPAAFLLVAWGRTGQWPAIARGQLLSWGRKPWLGLKLRSWLRNP